jgi:hypothetical protein
MAVHGETHRLLDRAYALPGGPRVRVRLARSSDARAIAELAARRRLELEPLRARRLTRFDPCRRLVVCASALIDSRETLVGVVAVDLDRGEPFAPDTLICDERIGGLAELLCEVLAARARAILRRPAA